MVWTIWSFNSGNNQIKYKFPFFHFSVAFAFSYYLCVDVFCFVIYSVSMPLSLPFFIQGYISFDILWNKNLQKESFQPLKILPAKTWFSLTVNYGRTERSQSTHVQKGKTMTKPYTRLDPKPFHLIKTHPKNCTWACHFCRAWYNIALIPCWLKAKKVLE